MSNQTIQPSSAKSFEMVEDLYNSYSKIAYAFALKILHNPVMAEDAVHDAFLRYLRSPQSFDPARGQFVTWLLTVLRNICFDQLRKNNRKNEVSSLAEDIPDHLENLTDCAMRVEEEVWIKLQRSNIQAALKTIPADQRRLIELAFFECLTHKEIETVTGLPLGTIKSRIRQGLLKLKIHLDADKIVYGISIFN